MFSSSHFLAAAALVVVPLGCGESDGLKATLPNEDPLALTMPFTTFVGGSADELLRDVAIDAQGNLYLAGGTASPDFPVTPGAYDVTFNQSGSKHYDAFVMKLDPTGHVIWSTLLGGPEYDRIYGIEVDELGYVYVAGRAGAGFPVTAGALQTTFAGASNPEPSYGPQDGFLCKLQPDGTRVVFCTYLGNQDYVPLRDIAVDANHDIYVYTSALSAQGFPAGWFANAYQKTVRGNRDALIIKVHGDGSRVEWATFLGGSGNETNTGSVRVDGAGVYAAMATSSADLPTPNGFDHSLGGSLDAYAAKLSLDGSQLLYGTYVGGGDSEDTETHHLAIDGQGNAFVAVPTRSTDFPTTASFQRQSGGARDILLVKIAPSGSLVAASYVGGSGDDGPEGVAVDGAGNVFVVGRTDSPNFPASSTEGPGGGVDVVAFALAPDLSRMIFSRRMGGRADDYGRAAAARGSAYLVGGTSGSMDWPVAAAFQASRHGSVDGIATALAWGH